VFFVVFPEQRQTCISGRLLSYYFRSCRKAAVGFEPTNNGFANHHTKNVTTRKQDSCKFDEKNLARFLALLAEKKPDLAQVVERWPNLPEHIKAAIKTLVSSYLKEAD
jgi:hypothetical protein